MQGMKVLIILNNTLDMHIENQIPTVILKAQENQRILIKKVILNQEDINTDINL
jgi:hypothetical protein